MKQNITLRVYRVNNSLSRDEDPEDTFIICSFYGRDDKYAVFGIKSRTAIQELFFSIIKLIQSEEEILRNKVSYVDDKEFNDISSIWGKVSSKIGDNLRIQKEISKKTRSKYSLIDIYSKCKRRCYTTKN